VSCGSSIKISERARAVLISLSRTQENEDVPAWDSRHRPASAASGSRTWCEVREGGRKGWRKLGQSCAPHRRQQNT